MEYTSYDFKAEVGLADQLVNYILSKEYWIKRIWRDIPDGERGRKKRLMALRILAHFREYEKLSSDNLRTLSHGTHLREGDRAEVLDILAKYKLLKKSKIRNVYIRGKKLYR